jgi:ABC-2 type transport system ATP-binding protein
VLAALEEVGLSAESVTVGRPSLDDVYLRHVGRRFEGPAVRPSSAQGVEVAA